MRRKSIKGIFTSPMDINADPIIENSKLPSMDDVKQKEDKPQKGKNYMPEMSQMKKITITKKAVKEGKFMAPFDPESISQEMVLPKDGFVDQISKPIRSKSGVGYVVLRMRVQDGKLSVVGSKKVDSPLLENEALLQGGLTYDAFVNQDRISIGSIPDYGEQRSFARPGQQDHHITILPSFDFNLRIPANKISLKDLPKLNVTLYKFKEHVPELTLKSLPIKEQFQKEVRVVAELNGIKLSNLNKDVTESLKKTLGNK